MKKFYKPILNVKRYFTKGYSSSGSVRSPQPRYGTSVTGRSSSRQHKESSQRSFHGQDLLRCSVLPRSRVYGDLKDCCSPYEPSPQANGRSCPNGPLYLTKSWNVPDPSFRHEQCSDDWQDQCAVGIGPRSSFCHSLCVPSQELSSVLLDNMNVKNLVIGPGAMGYFTFLGILSTFNQLKEVQEISGASAGAILSLFIGLEFSIEKIIDVSFGTNLKDLVQYNIKNILSDYGFINHSQIKNTLITICEGEPTFKDLKKKVYISAYNVNLCRTEYFSVDTHPNMSVIDAVCMSVSVPLMFCAFEYNGMHYVDGGTAEKIPVPPFFNKNFDEVLAIRLKYSSVSVDRFENVKDYLNALMKSFLNNRIDYDNIFKTISVDLSDVNVFDFHMSEEDKIKLFIRGQKILSTNNI